MISAATIIIALTTYGVPGKDLPTFLCIVEKESNFNSKAVNKIHNRNGTVDYGLFQINSVHLPSLKMSGTDLLDPMKNIKAAVYVYNKQGLTAWSTYDKCAKQKTTS